MFAGTSTSSSIVYFCVADLKKELQFCEIKLQRVKEVFKTTIQDYRDACYMLLGYKMDRVESGLCRLSSMYAESKDDYLQFKVCSTTKIPCV
jgi:mitotic spindle assembly checkpoint protein MAD1